MRILKISDVYFPRVNGVSTSIQTFAHEMLRQGHEITLIAPEYPTAYDDSFEIVRVPSRFLYVDPEDRMMKRRALRRLLPALRERQFDIVHVHTPFVAHYAGLEAARELGAPVVESYHTYFEEYLGNYLPWLPRAVLRHAARSFSRKQCAAVDALVVPTRPMLEVLRGYGIRARAEVVPTGIPGDQFRNGDGARFRQRHGIAETRRVLLYVGRVAHEKNIGFLLHVIDHLRERMADLLLVIAGEGPAVGHLKRLRDTLRLEGHVQFVGYLSRKGELADCYAAGDVFVFASRTETQGLVLLEAMQAGTPVVTTAIMGTAEVMADRLGGLVADESVDDFSNKVAQVLLDAELHTELSRQAIQKAHAWSAPATTSQMLTLYRDCCGSTASDTLPLHDTG